MPGMGARGAPAKPPTGAASSATSAVPEGSAPGQSSANASSSASRNRIPTTLKSALKKPAPLIRRATGSTNAPQAGSASGGAGQAAAGSGGDAAARAKSAAAQNRFKGTPPRAIRYSLPVRTEKPVRTTKISGKHIVLPSESQLAPLPGQEEDDDDDDDDDDDESSSSSDADEADDEDLSRANLDEEEAERQKQLRKDQREAAAKAQEERRQRKADEKAARKPDTAAGHASRKTPTAGVPGGLSPAFTRGPAHARAPPRIPKASGPAYHTFERLAPSSRVRTPLPRLTSYAIGTDLHIPTLNGFLRREHSVRPRLYDECAYVVYFKPLLPGFGRANIRSSPEAKVGSPGAESRREREMEEREERGYVGSYFAPSKDDNEESMDPEGYIQGFEGSGSGEGEQRRGGSNNNNRQEQRRERQDYGGETTENETETEAERGGSHDLDLVSSPEGASHVRPGNMTIEDSEPDELDSMPTPRALKPRDNEVPGDDIDALEQLDDVIREESTSSPIEGEALPADAAGALDMLTYQQTESPSQKGLDPTSETDEVALNALEGGDEVSKPDRRNSSPTRIADGVGHASSDSAPYQVSTDDQPQPSAPQQRRRRNKTKSRKYSGPNQSSHNHDITQNMLAPRNILEALQVAELVILPYGVIVFYNFTASEERDIIDDVISSGCVRGPLPQDDVEQEAFHFCYDPTVPAPRIFNDFFTFRAPNHLLKLSLAHAIAQSTKLSVFEESMQKTLELTSHIPKELASSGELKLKRREALRLTGRLFKLRVDVNLTSNVLDTPELFWSEATLQALYDAIREYLEIDQRVGNLNDRLKVANDLLEIIHGHVAEEAMSKITVVIIALIVVACIVACGEISARLILHARSRSNEEQVMMAYMAKLAIAGGEGSSRFFDSAGQLALGA
ncbi:DUF155-domain-containing protein [Microstroma glucosiphilum]|uniref:DUF155-domain-containing protein n=1 Tax=Pseudomicrostroma glucosiphilum TaxID=1684307 RepID=A0A316U5K4_9BASI|nr:DUF155-domain-containing protein [Pseudomicrostroma glucosiphilum]PWN20509.1 DUF155-domain-containing protein [Pseudomicrostroma glucosiphilum]